MHLNESYFRVYRFALAEIVLYQSVQFSVCVYINIVLGQVGLLLWSILGEVTIQALRIREGG